METFGPADDLSNLYHFSFDRVANPAYGFRALPQHRHFTLDHRKQLLDDL